MARVLIVDDAVFMRKVLTNILKKGGHTVVGEAGNGEEGYKKYMELKPDIVTLDMTMPGTSGIDALKLIMNYDPNANCIMCSAMGQKMLVTEAVQNGAKNFIVKPFTADVVLDAISKIIQ